MNNDLSKFVSNMGILCETWLVVYNQFISHSMEHKVALEHTQAFMKSFMGSVNDNKEGES